MNAFPPSEPTVVGRRRRVGRLPALLVIAALALAACGDAEEQPPAGGGSPTIAPTPEGSPETSPGSPAAGGAETVIVDNVAFEDAELRVAPGTTVTWDNQDALGHTVTHGTNGSAAPNARFDLTLPAGDTVEYTFEEPGTVPVTCSIHPTMQMQVVVE